MEVWEDGAVLGPGRLLVLLAVAFAVVMGFNALAGFRRDRTASELVVDTVQAIGLSALVAALALAVLGRLDPDLGVRTLLGRIAIETIPVAIGMSLASTVMGEPDEGGTEGNRPPIGVLGRLVVAAAGALYFALNVAPTEEVRRIAGEASPPQLIAAIGAGLLIDLAIVFHAEFRGGRGSEDRRGEADGPLRTPLGESAVAYVLALLVSLLLLWAFGSTDGATPYAIVAQVVMLGVVAAFGAAAGRLLVGGGGGEQRQRGASA